MTGKAGKKRDSVLVSSGNRNANSKGGSTKKYQIVELASEKQVRAPSEGPVIGG